MREYFTYGSVRGAAGNGGPYRDPPQGRGRGTTYTSYRAASPSFVPTPMAGH